MYFTASLILAYIAAIGTVVPAAGAAHAIDQPAAVNKNLEARQAYYSGDVYYSKSKKAARPAAATKVLQARDTSYYRGNTFYVTRKAALATAVPTGAAEALQALQAREVHDEH